MACRLTKTVISASIGTAEVGFIPAFCLKMNIFTGYLTRSGQSVRQRIKRHNLTTRSAMLSMTMRIAVLPLIPLTAAAAVPSTADLDQPPSTQAVLSVRTAPEEMAKSSVGVSVTVGESKADEMARKDREAAAAAALQHPTKTVNRVVIARDQDERTNGSLSIDEARAKTAAYAAMYGVDAELMAKIIACESGYNQFAKNSGSSASGYGQFMGGTWDSTVRALGWDASTSPFDGDKNLQATAYLMSVRGTSPWNSSRGCWAR